MGREIVIEPFDPSRLNPNSYNLSPANDELLVYENEPAGHEHPESHPAKLRHPAGGTGAGTGRRSTWAGPTGVHTAPTAMSPCWRGDPPPARLGLFIHVTAGIWRCRLRRATGRWRSSASSPSASTPGVQICQIYYHDIDGEYVAATRAASTRTTTGIQPSLLYRDFQE